MMDRCEGGRGGLPIVSEVARQNCWSCTTFSTMSVFFSSCARTLASVFSDPMSKRWRPPFMERTYRASIAASFAKKVIQVPHTLGRGEVGAIPAT